MSKVVVTMHDEAERMLSCAKNLRKRAEDGCAGCYGFVDDLYKAAMALHKQADDLSKQEDKLTDRQWFGMQIGEHND